MNIHIKQKNLDSDLILFIRINSRWITDLNVKCKTVKILKDNIGENIDDLGFDDDIFDATLEVQSMKER